MQTSGVLKRTKAKFSFPGVEFGLYIGSNQIGLLSGKSFSVTLSLNSDFQLEGVIFALQGTFHIFGAIFVCLHLVEYYWHLVGGGQGCCFVNILRFTGWMPSPFAHHDRALQTQNYSMQDVSSSEDEKLCPNIRYLFFPNAICVRYKFVSMRCSLE